MSFVCSICGKEPVPQPTQGTWKCLCAVGGKEKGWPAASLVPDESTASSLSPVADNPDEEAYYEKLDKDGK
jgi:hypothetical protein